MTTLDDRFELTHYIPASRDIVFEAWAHPSQVNAWFAPPDCTISHYESDVRVGGRYRVVMKCGEQNFVTFGTYREVVPEERLVFTCSEDGPDPDETVFTVEFRDHGMGTEVILIEEGLTDPEKARLHQEGWTSALENLARRYQARAA